LLRGFLALRVCRNCSCRGESFLINLAFINLPSYSLVLRNGSPKGVLHKPKKKITRRASMRPRRPGINSTQKLLTLDFPPSPSLRNFAGFTPGASWPGRGGFSSLPEIMESKPVKRSGEGKKFRRVARTLGSTDGEPANLMKCQD
jgi:hypothetical protein